MKQLACTSEMGRSSCRSRQDLTISEASVDEQEFPVDHIKVGSYYEIDHSKLPSSSPVQLQMVKIVMVCGKNDRVISVRYPSIFSLKSYFRSGSSAGGNVSRSCSGSGSTSTKMQKAMKFNPALDEKYSMVNRVAALVLFRQIKLEEFVKSRGSMSFWAAGQPSGSGNKRIATRSSLSSGGKVMMMAANRRGSGGFIGVGSSSGLTVYQRKVAKTGECLSALQSGKVTSWGKRQKVKYVSNYSDSAAGDDSNPQVITPPNEDKSVDEEQLSKGNQRSDYEKREEETQEDVKMDVKEEEDQEEGDEDDEAVSDEEVKPKIPLRRNRKRKCKVVAYNQQSRIPNKKPKRETTFVRKMGLTRGQKRRGHKESINRWSADRYKLAEENMLKIMREKGAVLEKPILRQKLRDEARKVIGDTGLLDHLLKHMAGRIAPDGEERFRRRHNAEGAMEYWLESADLVEIRKMAGVSDPYWNPPPGWKLGDNPSQNPVCAVEIRQLKEEVNKMKRDLNELQMTKKPAAEAEIVATTPLSCVSEQNMINDLEVLPLKESHEELVKRKLRLEQQMIKVSHYLTEMEEEMEKLSKVEKTTSREVSDGTAGCLTLASEKNEAAEGNNDNGMSQTQLEVIDQTKGHKIPAEEAAAVAGAKTEEEKAAKIQRLKSGFRICKPQGSFKWPNSSAVPYNCSNSISSSSSSSSQLLSPSTNLEYFLAAQTPPSVSSTTTKSPSLPILTQPTTIPVKPLARRLAAAGAAAAIPIPSYLPRMTDLTYVPRPAVTHTNLTDWTEQYHVANIPDIYSHSQRSNQNLDMIPKATASNHVQGKYSSMSPRLAAETNRVMAYGDEEQGGKKRRASHSADTSPSAVATNTWVSVPYLPTYP